ncbi:ABC transporter ATP-binding protein [Lichenibacterium ramalinae]|uniref:ABC transporter ATP-binding protein n=1 Tax=Lichenibacterium ramalinae TaxID=2316527 RepID=A0A4V1RIU0_9HYPH|nr:ABC transporter ATP-binding protein [Lichenibacterium ramalinae]RYB05637.1 ABC transporter ATP-binding protein [Lichenibacterium ramalinae]
MTATVPALALRGLRKGFGPGRPAVDGLDLVVPAGAFYALLGPNGAGKTTTLRMVAGLLRPDAGHIAIHGIDAVADSRAAKSITAWLPDDPLLYDKLTPIEYLGFVGGLWSVPPDRARRGAEALLERLGLADHRDQRCEGFSRGMKQKVALAGALVHEPRLLILDEPLTGLDAGAARTVKAILGECVASGATVILTTHILEVAERLASRIGIIRRGRLAAEGTVAELQAAGGGSLEEAFLSLTGSDRDGA